ncbi:MAG TPA: CAP domain-containing protein [Acidimicrobiales bacterium]|nr:CAP domain-containing protein [Acidimicrobiales bacterium]
MKKFWAPFVALGIVLSGATVLAAPASADTGSDEMGFVQKLNELRTSRGLPALGTRVELSDMARAWSGRMAGAGGISHNPDLAAQAPGDWARLGENVGIGPGVQSLHDAFVASPLHFKNMIDPEFDWVGVGVVNGPPGIIYVTVNFMRTHAAAPEIVKAVAPVAQAAATVAPATKRVCTRSRKGRVTCRTVKVRKARVSARRAR